MKSTKKTLVISVICLMLCASLFVGATFAWFTDSVTSGVNQIVAGNLDVEVLHTNAYVTTPEKIDDPAVNAMFTDKDGNEILWEPGAVSYETFTVQNVGTLALKYGMAMNILDYNTVVEANNTPTDHNLSEVLKVKVLKENKLTKIDRDTVSALDWSADDVKTLKDFEMNGEGVLYPKNNLPTNESNEPTGSSSDEFQVIVYWDPTDSDNTWNLQNGKYASDARASEDDTTSVGQLYIKFGVVLKATQVDYEADSFDKDYDKGLSVGDIGLTNINKTETIVKTSTNPVISSDAKKDGKSVVEVTLPTSVLTLDSNDVNLNVYRDDTANGNFQAESEKEGSSINLTGKDTITYEVNVTVNGVEVESTEGLYKVDMYVGKGLIDLEMYHKNALMTDDGNTAQETDGHFTYNKTTGFVTMYVNSFSPFTSVFLDDGDASDGLHYHQGSLFSGECNKNADEVEYLYKDGEKYTGIYEEKYYSNGVMGSGEYLDIVYDNGDKLTGIYNDKYYKDGVLGTGDCNGYHYVDGEKDYQLNKIYEKDGKYYYNGSLANGKLENLIYKDGAKYTGVHTDNKYYKDGVLFDGDYDGYHYEKGEKKYPLNTVYQINNRYYYNGSVANGEYGEYKRKFVDGEPYTNTDAHSRGYISGYAYNLIDKSNDNDENNYVGYYADVDGNGSIDGVIFFDYAFGAEQKSGFLSDEDQKGVKVESIDGPGYLSAYGLCSDHVVRRLPDYEDWDRFYVIALEDATPNKVTWYKSAASSKISATDTGFWQGAANTQTSKSKFGSYGAKDNGDLWNLNIPNGWFVLSKDEWIVMGSELNRVKQSGSYSSLKTNAGAVISFGSGYWTSSIFNNGNGPKAYYANFEQYSCPNYNLNASLKVRLATTY